MSDKLELEVNVTGVEQAIDQVQAVQDAGQAPAGGGGSSFNRDWDPFVAGQPPPHDWRKALTDKQRAVVEDRERRKIEAMHEASHRATLRYRVQQGRREIRERERLERDATREEQRMKARMDRERIQEEKRVRRENIAIENAAIRQDNAARKRRQQSIDAGMGLATKVGAAVAATTMLGFRGTVEGQRFSNEMKMISRELAGVFKPTMDLITKSGAGRIRHWLQNLSETQQDILQYAGTAAAAIYIANKTGILHLTGAAIGGTARFAMNNPAMAKRIGLYGAAAYGAYNAYDTVSSIGTNQQRRDAVINRGGDFTADELKANRDVFDAYNSAKDGAARSQLLKRMYMDAASQQKNAADMLEERTAPGMMFSTLGLNPLYETTGHKEAHNYLMRMKMISRMMEDEEFARTGVDQTNPNRRRVMDASTVGYGGVGSTAEMIQEEMLKVTSDDMEIKTAKEESKILTGAVMKILAIAQAIAANQQEPPANPPG